MKLRLEKLNEENQWIFPCKLWLLSHHTREKEELFPIGGVIFVTLEMRDLKMRDAILEDLPLLILWGERENLGISFPLKMLV